MFYIWKLDLRPNLSVGTDGLVFQHGLDVVLSSTPWFDLLGSSFNNLVKIKFDYRVKLLD